MVSLDALLRSRDERFARQKELLAAYPGCNLVCLTVMFPGAVKRSKDSLIVGGAGLAALLGRFSHNLKHSEVHDFDTGYEAFLLLTVPAKELKRICCEIEETHPLGRLMDIDVLGPDGIPIGRDEIGLPPRKCLLCDRDARICMRERAHDYNELNDRIIQIIDAYVI